MIYFLFFFILVFFMLLTFRDRKISVFSLFIFILFLIIFVGFRYKVGADWFSYINIFNAVSQGRSSTSIGYRVINILSYKLGYDIIFVNFICAVLLFSCILFFLQKTKYPLINLVVLFPYTIVVIAMNYTKQSVAIGFSMIAIYYLVYKFNNAKFILFLFLAFLFHASAIFLILFLPFVYIKKMKFKSKYFYIIIGLILIFFVYLFKYYFTHLQILYLSNSMFSSGVFVRITIHLLPLLIYAIYRKKYKDLNYEFLDFTSLFILFSIPFSFHFSTLVDRLNLYFIVFDIIVLDRFIYLLKFKSKILFLLFLIVVNFFILYIWYTYSFHAINYWRPYKNYLLDMLL